MVDMDRVLAEIKRTAYVGVGTFGSTFVGNFLDDFIPGGDVGVGATQTVAGAAAAAVIDDRMGSRETLGLDFDAGEAAKHASYGVGGAGFAEFADALNEGSLLGQYGRSQREMVEVRTRSNAGSASQSQSSSQSQQDREILIDSA